MRFILGTFIGFTGLVLASCGGQGAQPLRVDPGRADTNPATAPLIKISFNDFDPEITTLRFSEGETVRFKLENISEGVQTASLSQTTGPTIKFGTMKSDGEESDEGLDTSTGSNPIQFTLNDADGPRIGEIDRLDQLSVEFTAPSVTDRTTLNFQFRSSNGTISRSRTIPVIIEDDAGALTLSGQVSKGLVKNTKIRLFSVDRLNLIFSGNREIVDPVLIDENGAYRFTVLPSTDFEELLRFEVKGKGADMICDAPQGCNGTTFGETFEVEDDLDLRALIEVPPLGSLRTANVNILTTLATKRAGQLNNLRRVSPANLRDGRRDVASVFGLPVQTFSSVPFVDVTQPIVSQDDNAIRIAMIGGGVLGGTFLHADPDDDEDYLEELDDFIDTFGDRQVFCRDAPDQNTLSIEDVMERALEIARINGNLSTRNFFLQRLTEIRNGTFTCQFTTPPDPE